MTPDGSPFICRTPMAGLYFNGGWCYQGFKATPAVGWCFAHTIAHDEEHPLVRHSGLTASSAETATMSTALATGRTSSSPMLRIHCPNCGERDYTEFRYGGDAVKRQTRARHAGPTRLV